MSPSVDHVTTADAIDASLPSAEPPDARLLTHAYDGIREYDNPLPGWWKAIFWASIGFAALYLVYYHVAGWGSSPAERYESALATYQEQRAKQDPTAGITEDMLARRSADPAAVQRGQAVFASRCASCHGPDGGGLIGPNLTDHFQLHGESRMDIYKTVVSGVPNTAMLGWRELMSGPELLDVTAFAGTLRGKNLPGKAAQGKPVAAFP